MALLAQLLAHHHRILVLDAASTTVAVGLLRGSQPAIWRTATGDATREVFSLTQSVLADAGLTIAQVDAFIFCEGPGSMLGIRTTAMAVRSWQTLAARPAYSYQSLALAAHREFRRQRRGFAVVADARRDTWHVQSITPDGRSEALRRTPTADLPAGELLTPENFRAWSTAPVQLRPCPYLPAELFAECGDADLFTRRDAPDAFQHEAPEYLKWSAQLHSADSVARK